eukprot:CAMPEP_0172171482 /NCGR_PEP_ID=MMETSP1050-20130122/11919_1 /TAXON_ID=233186 /ORGANISM="Cryptomonas curvata, Strain CCAP979/52" /LENGTH=63 /DNA_ID=CAMNT_0012842923 /DNA_START=192 /DNA_END=383 /DNA_ORIENTATION=-
MVIAGGQTQRCWGAAVAARRGRNQRPNYGQILVKKNGQISVKPRAPQGAARLGGPRPCLPANA